MTWDPCGESSVPDDARAQIAGEYDESETEPQPQPLTKGEKAGCAVIMLGSALFWLFIVLTLKKWMS
jgi:hypothetical protein